MAVSYRFIRNLEVAIKDWEKCSSNLGKSLRGEGWEDYFELKLRSEVCGGVCILKIVSMYSFTGALKTRVLLFQNFFQTRLR